MIYFLYGADTYRSRKKLKEIVEEFRKKSGGVLGVTRVDAGENPEAVYDIGRTGSFFQAKELFIIENVLSLDPKPADFAAERCDFWANSKEVIVVFWEAEIDSKKSKLFEGIKKRAAKEQNFELLSGAKLEAWISKEAAAREAGLGAAEIKLLAARLGGDLWSAANELDKISCGWSAAKGVKEEEKIWNMTDAFLKNRRSSFRPLMNLLADGYDPIYIIGALAGALRNLAQVWQGVQDGEVKKATAKLSPYVARKNTELARGMDASRLDRCFDDLVRTDLELKTGRLPPPWPLIKLVLKQG